MLNQNLSQLPHQGIGEVGCIIDVVEHMQLIHRFDQIFLGESRRQEAVTIVT
jgi:hypothetical protein